MCLVEVKGGMLLPSILIAHDVATDTASSKASCILCLARPTRHDRVH